MKMRCLSVFSITAVAILVGCSESKLTEPTIEEFLVAEGLVAFYPFNGDAMDVSGNSFDAAVEGATLTQDRFGREGSAYEFDGEDDRIVGPPEHFADNNKITLSLWLNQLDPPETLGFFLISSDFSAATRGASASFVIGTVGTNNASGPTNAGQWNHLLGTFDGNTIRVYINGRLAGETFWPGNIAELNRRLTFGSFGNRFWRGRIDDVRIYNRVLIEDEIQVLFHERGWDD